MLGPIFLTCLFLFLLRSLQAEEAEGKGELGLAVAAATVRIYTLCNESILY